MSGPRKLTEAELGRITWVVGDCGPNKLLFDNVPSDMTWGELVQCISDLLPRADAPETEQIVEIDENGNVHGDVRGVVRDPDGSFD